VDQQRDFHCGGASEILARAGFDAACSDELTDVHHEIEAKAFIHFRDCALGSQMAAFSTRSQEILDPVAHVAFLWASRRGLPMDLDRRRISHRGRRREEPEENQANHQTSSRRSRGLRSASTMGLHEW
jgi:hypothetical protein